MMVHHFNESKEIIASNTGCKENSQSTESDGCGGRPLLLSCQVRCMYDLAEECLHKQLKKGIRTTKMENHR
jgi:hypothetical protein